VSAPGAIRPLAGIRVLDLSRVLAGPYATQILADLGAEVWKIERPGSGDETRAWGPPFVGGVSAYYLAVNRNKRSAALDFGSETARAAILAAARQCDIVVENFVPGDLDRYGLDGASLRRSNPDLVVCSITGFGQDGPYSRWVGYDAVMQGFVGLQSVTGFPDGPPVKVGVAVVDVMTGAHAAAAILGALVGKLRGAGGVHLDVPLLEVGVASLVNVSQAALGDGPPPRRWGTGHPQIVPYQTFEAQDGAIVIAVGNDEQWKRLCAALGAEDLAGRSEFVTNPGRVRHRDEVVGALSARFAKEPRATLLARLREARVPAGPVREMAEVMGDPVFVERDFIRPARLPESGEAVRLLALPWRLNGTRPPLELPPPALGQHTAEFLARFGASTA
jgi:crotonobetainyl-CoA:carnitine CoA-transferase CaiB-like acyl-CoA transferase